MVVVTSSPRTKYYKENLKQARIMHKHEIVYITFENRESVTIQD